MNTKNKPFFDYLSYEKQNQTKHLFI